MQYSLSLKKTKVDIIRSKYIIDQVMEAKVRALFK